MHLYRCVSTHLRIYVCAQEFVPWIHEEALRHMEIKTYLRAGVRANGYRAFF